MLYRPYGQTGKDVSVISAGCMRFDAPENDADVERAADILLHAHERGINYFDTAPLYCEDRSEEIVGRALRQLDPGSYYVSTKSGDDTGEELRQTLERSLERLGVDRIDFFHIWCLLKPETWETRKREGALDAALRAQDEGLIEHLVFSTHMTGKETAEVIRTGYFDGVTLGFNAINFPYRRDGVAAAREAKMGVVTMNPLGGGLIPQHAGRFAFVASENDPDVLTAALRFNVSYPGVTSALVGFNAHDEVDAAVAAVEGFKPWTENRVHDLEEHIQEEFEGLCTGCGYCLPCPAGVPIPKFMDVYNMKLLDQDPGEIQIRLKLHWDLEAEAAGACTACGQCEQSCTQHLPIIERLEEISRFTPPEG